MHIGVASKTGRKVARVYSSGVMRWSWASGWDPGRCGAVVGGPRVGAAPEGAMVTVSVGKPSEFVRVKVVAMGGRASVSVAVGTPFASRRVSTRGGMVTVAVGRPEASVRVRREV